MTSPSKLNQRRLWMHVTMRKNPYGNKVREWAHNRNITMAEMLERMVKTYAAMSDEELIKEDDGD